MSSKRKNKKNKGGAFGKTWGQNKKQYRLSERYQVPEEATHCMTEMEYLQKNRQVIETWIKLGMKPDIMAYRSTAAESQDGTGRIAPMIGFFFGSDPDHLEALSVVIYDRICDTEEEAALEANRIIKTASLALSDEDHNKVLINVGTGETERIN